MEKYEEHLFLGQAFYEEQCKKNEALKYARQKHLENVEPRRCAYCGSFNYYAKNLCRGCYSRTIEKKPLERRYSTESANKISIRLNNERREEAWERKVCRKAFRIPFPYEIPEEKMQQTLYMLEALNDKQLFIIQRHFKDGATLNEISKEFGLTRERIRQIEARAMSRIQLGPKTSLARMESKKDASVFCGYRMSKRSKNALRKAKIKTMKQLGNLIANGELNSIRNIGMKSANEIMLVFTDWYYNRGK